MTDARVDFRVYNYAEFYNLVSKTSDANGTATLTCGQGDLLVWASKDGMFGLQKASVGKDSVVTVMLDKQPGYCGKKTTWSPLWKPFMLTGKPNPTWKEPWSLCPTRK